MALLAKSSVAAQVHHATPFATLVNELHNAAGSPGMGVAVLRNGKPVHIKGYGAAGPDGHPVTVDTAFQIGSITKSMVALIILQLAAEGKLGLDDSVVLYLPNFRTADKSISDQITVDHLVTHRSGLTTLDGNRRTADVLDPAKGVEVLANTKLYAPPGTSFQYSNANYIVLTHLVEQLDNRPIEEALEERIFRPLAMSNSFVHQSDKSAAMGHRLWFGIPVEYNPGPTLDRTMIGAGGVWASIRDLATYVEAVRSRNATIVPRGADRLFRIHEVTKQWGYAYGWYSQHRPRGLVFEHSGFTPGFHSLATMVSYEALEDESAVVIVLTNMAGLAHGELPRAVTYAALDWEPLQAAPRLSARAAIWSALAAPFGLLLLLYKTVKQILVSPPALSHLQRYVHGTLVILLLALAYMVYLGFPTMVGVNFSTGMAFFPDLTITAVATIITAALLAVSRFVWLLRSTQPKSSLTPS